MNELVLSDDSNFDAMALAMGMSADAKTGGSSLARIRINHNPIMGMKEIDGKKIKIEVVEGGVYKLEIPDGPTYYSSHIVFRPFLQRFMYQRFIKGHGDNKDFYMKTIMAPDLDKDLKDNAGGFNCGKPSGYIKDFKALSKDMQDLLKSVRRVRCMFGVVTMVDPVDHNGEPVEVEPTPIIFETHNRDAFKDFGNMFNWYIKRKCLPPQHEVDLTTTEQSLPNGDVYYIPAHSIKEDVRIPLTEDDQDLFSDFVQWVDNYNTYIYDQWTQKAKSEPVSEEDASVVDQYIDIDVDIETEEGQ